MANKNNKMEIIIQKSELLSKLAIFQHTIKTKTINPIVQYIKITTNLQDKTIALHGTDLDLFLIEYAKAEVLSKGEVLVLSKKFYDIIRYLPDGSINISVDEKLHVNIRSGNCHIKLSGLSPEEFPIFPDKGKNTTTYYSIPLDSLSEMLKKVIFCVNDNDSRPALTGVYLHTYNPKNNTTPNYLLRAVGTDGHRLALAQECVNNTPNKTKNIINPALINGIILPKKACQELIRLAQQEDLQNTSISLEIFPNLAGIFSVNFTFLTKYIKKPFPPYQSILDKPPATIKVFFPKITIINVLKRFQSFTSFTFPDARFTFSQNKLKLCAQNPELGEIEEEIRLNEDIKNTLSIYFNVRSMLECISIVPSKEVELSFWGPEEPLIIRSKNRSGYLALVMPMKNPEETN